MINKENNTRIPELYEMVNEIDKAEGKSNRIKLIKEFSRYMCFQDWLRCMFDDRIQFLLPEGRPPYTPSGQSYPTTWHKQHLELKYFVKGLGDNVLNQLKREMKFIGILESIHPEDAVLVADAMDKRNKTSIQKSEVEEAIPGLIS
jgi:hypothetical protein